ncbi:LysR family transcriptional regulator [Aliamphritea ceti]|uniref:LysR family transcriptional regulator n=1 Tax=Aliamphritea ceti TaxID=1524258 RepID=UPI0021C2FA83|nr:LysR family transcriptional regulator [Aliamphritea ceti]
MELKWLIDFIALVEHGSFSKAAESRFVTQPAFSRRIRSLENWLGVSLVDRDQYPTTLTPTGVAFAEQAQLLINQTYAVRQQMQAISQPREQVQVISQHALAVSFFPDWMQTLETSGSDTLIKVDAGNLHDAMDAFLSGNGDFLLSYASHEVFQQMQRDDIENLDVGHDRLIPVSLVKDGQPMFGGDLQQPVRLLSHPAESFFGRLLQQRCLSGLTDKAKLHSVCENALSEALKALVLKGHGMAWVPESLVAQELASGQLTILPAPFDCVELSIKLYRLGKPANAACEAFWNHLQG